MKDPRNEGKQYFDHEGEPFKALSEIVQTMGLPSICWAIEHYCMEQHRNLVANSAAVRRQWLDAAVLFKNMAYEVADVTKLPPAPSVSRRRPSPR